MKTLRKAVFGLFFLTVFSYCSSTDSKFIITSFSWKNQNNSNVQCKEVFSKRVFFFACVIPLNKIDRYDLRGIDDQKSLMYSQGLQGLDLFYTLMGAAFGLIVQTQIVEACSIAETKPEPKQVTQEKKSCYYDRNFKKIFCKNKTYHDPETEYNIGVFERLFMLY